MEGERARLAGRGMRQPGWCARQRGDDRLRRIGKSAKKKKIWNLPRQASRGLDLARWREKGFYDGARWRGAYDRPDVCVAEPLSSGILYTTVLPQMTVVLWLSQGRPCRDELHVSVQRKL